MGNSSSCLSPASSQGRCPPQLASPSSTQHRSHCRSQFQAAGQSGISRRKFSEIMQQCFPRTHKSDLEDFVFQLYDLNGDGKIGYEEFQLIVTVMNEGSTEQKMEEIFRVLDSDRNGFITKEEITKLVVTLYHLLPAKDRAQLSTVDSLVEGLIREADSDLNGVITQEELTRAVLRSDHLTTVVLNKIVIRFSCSSINILSSH